MPAEKITATLKDQPCPVCGQKKLALTEAESEVPYFGKLFLFSMHCESCKYHKSDVEAAEHKGPCKVVFEVNGKDDLGVRVIKSSEASVKFERVGSIEPGPASEGYITNVEGLIQRIKEQIEKVRDLEEDALRAVAHLGIGAAHHACEPDRPLTVGDDELAAVERDLFSVKE